MYVSVIVAPIYLDPIFNFKLKIVGEVCEK